MAASFLVFLTRDVLILKKQGLVRYADDDQPGHMNVESAELAVQKWDGLKSPKTSGKPKNTSENVKSIPPNTEKWLRKRYDENYNNDTSNETKRETNYSINNKCNDMNTRNMHIT